MVSHQGTPAVIRDEETESVRRFVAGLTETGLEPESVALPEYRRGQPLCVMAGPFKGCEAASWSSGAAAVCW